MMDVDHRQLAQELIRGLRGPRSQVQFSRRLGFSTNTLYSWESGRRTPNAERFFHAVVRSGRDLVGAMRTFFRRKLPWLEVEPGSKVWIANMLATLRGGIPLRALAERTSHSRFALARWVSGQSSPSLPAMLQFVDATTSRLLDFVDLFVDVDALPVAEDALQRSRATREAAESSPWNLAVFASLALDNYRALPRHSSSWLAERLGRSELEVDQSLALLEAAGFVHRSASDHYEMTKDPQLTVRSHTAKGLRRHWSDVAGDRLHHPDGFAWYALFTASEATLGKLHELQRAHVRAVRSLVAQAEGDETRVVLMNLQLVPLDSPSNG